MPLTPKNRKEEWLEGLVEHETTLTPKNRCEAWMKEIIDASGGGGGGGGGVLVVGMDMQTMTLDKTWKEIHDAPLAVIKMFPDENTTSIAIINETDIVGGNDYKLRAFSMGVGSPSSVSFVATSADGYPVMNMG